MFGERAARAASLSPRRRHQTAAGGLFFVAAFFVLWTCLDGAPFEWPVWQTALLIAYGVVALVASIVLIRGTARAAVAVVPAALLSVLVFPFGTLLGGYAMWATFRTWDDAGAPDSTAAGSTPGWRGLPGSLTLVDWWILALSLVLLPYAALTRESIGAVHAAAALLVALAALVGVILGIVRRTGWAWLHGALLVAAVAVLAWRGMDAGYGP